MKKTIYFAICAIFFAAIFSCKSTQIEIEKTPVPLDETVEKPNGVKTYVNTSVNNATGNISTILVFNSIIEVTGIHPKTRERFVLDEKNYKYDKSSTELKINLPKEVPYSLNELGFHIVGYAADPGIFVLSGIDSKRSTVGVFFSGKKAAEGKDYIFDKSANRITSLVPLNVDEDSFQISWATKNGSVTFSNNTQKFKEVYQKLYNEWTSSVGL